MNERQIEICELLLPYFVKRGGQASDVEIFNELGKQGINQYDIKLIMDLLIDDYGIIKRNESRNDLKRLSPLGSEVSKIGMRKFIIKKNKEDSLKLISLQRSTTLPKWTIIISIFAVLVAAIGNVINYSQNKKVKSEYENYYSKTYIDSIIKQLRVENSKSYYKFDSILRSIKKE